MRALTWLVTATFFGAAAAQAQSFSTLGAAELRATRAPTLDATALPVPAVRSPVTVDALPTLRTTVEPVTRVRVGDAVPTLRLVPAAGVTPVVRDTNKTVTEIRGGRKATLDGERKTTLDGERKATLDGDTKGAKATDDKATGSMRETPAATAGSEASPAVARRLPAC